MLKAIGIFFVIVGLVYFLFYPFFKFPVNRKKFFKWFFILYGVAVFLSTAGNYLMKTGEPSSFREGVELIKKDKEIKAKLGVFKSLKFNRKDLPEKTDNPADLKFKLEGSKGTILIEGTVAKNGDGEWFVVKIKKDSLIENN